MKRLFVIAALVVVSFSSFAFPQTTVPPIVGKVVNIYIPLVAGAGGELLFQIGEHSEWWQINNNGQMALAILLTAKATGQDVSFDRATAASLEATGLHIQ